MGRELLASVQVRDEDIVSSRGPKAVVVLLRVMAGLLFVVLVVQSGRGEIAAVQMNGKKPGIRDTDARIPGFTFVEVGEVPSAQVTPHCHGADDCRYTYVIDRGGLHIVDTTGGRIFAQFVDHVADIVQQRGQHRGRQSAVGLGKRGGLQGMLQLIDLAQAVALGGTTDENLQELLAKAVVAHVFFLA